MSKRSALHRLKLSVAVAAASLSAGFVVADERYLDFVHKLQDRGYGELAVQYLTRLERSGDVPDEVRDVWELEFGKSLRISAGEAANTDQLQKRLSEALVHIDKFLTENPDHPASADALGSIGDIATHRGQLLIKSARAASDKAKQAELLTTARAAIEEARPRFTQSVERYQSALRELLPAPSETPKKEPTKKAQSKAIAKRPPRATSKAARDATAEREEAEQSWLEARFRLAMVDYSVAQTYGDPNDPDRKKSLERAAAGFDGIFQQNRLARTGLYAHMWEGRVRDEMGDLRTAKDIYEEVLGNAPDPGQPQAPTGFEPLFAQVEMFRLQLLLKTGDVAKFTEDAATWLRFHQSSRRTAGFQGIALELAKTQIEQAEKSGGEDRRRMFTLALRSLSEITKVQSEYQQDAFVLRRKYQEEVKGIAPDVASFDEGLSVGNSAASGGQWDEAVSAYARAVELASKEIEPERIVDARFRLARAQFMAGKVAECADTAEQIARNNLASRVAPQAAALATSAALALYTVAQDKAPALDRLMKMADYTIDHWPDRPEADEARIALGQSNFVTGDLQAAISVFEQVKPDSERYGSALYYAAQAYWRGYITDKQNRGFRDKAQERITASLDVQRKSLKPGDSLTRQMLDAQLLMGEMLLEGNQPQEAMPLLEPLIETIRSAKLEALDATTLRTLVAGLRGYIALGDLTKAGDVQSIVVQIGSDTPQVNGVLVDFAKLLGNEVKRAEAAAADATRDANSDALAAAQGNLKGTQEVLIRLLDQLAPRKQHSLVNQIYIADSYARAGALDKSREQCERVLKAVEEDPSLQAPGSGNSAVTRVRAQLAGLLRNEGKYDDAMREVEKLIKSNPRDLAPLMEKGRILQAWSEKEPQRVGEAIGHWTSLRTTLSRMQKKPPEYYEVVYNAATCLSAQAKQTKDKSKALQAEQLLKSSLVLSPNLSGPEMVARYNELLQELVKLQGR